ncbi:MAG: serine/threonine protein kinase [Labilithrix sp.]|nr:serine/threonine protein kinase [Labilithrix sp.]MCW5815247.1 serine/threonine protein kinase [Labilithrix sp.]
MLTLPPDDLLPVLVADLADDDAREVLDAAAFTGSTVWVPLETAPVSAAEHMLEVHTPSASEPFYYVAVALGPPTEDGFPLRLSPMDEDVDTSTLVPPAPKVPTIDEPVPAVRGKRAQTNMNLSESHKKELSHVGPLPTDDGQDSKIGRALAGGKLLLEHIIGRGGVGAVYKARHRELMMPVAVKVLHESFQNDIDFCRRFYAEALAASRLDHPNVTRVLDFGQEPDGSLYFAMEFLDGPELRALMDKEKVFPTQRIASIMMQVCAGLSHAHARGIVHRDVKPENLVLVKGSDDDGNEIEVVKVCDFGIALHGASDSPATGHVAGTPEYMSPEQCRADELDARSDIYAVGVILYEMATGQLPFQAEHVVGILNKHQFSPHPAPSKINPDVSPALEKIINKALEKEAPDRQQSMRELRAELRELLTAPTTQSVRELPAAEELELATPRRASPAVAETPSPRQQDNSDWIDRSAGYPGGAAAREQAPNTPNPASTSADSGDQLAPRTLAWTARLVKTTDPTAFAQGVQHLEGALRTLSQRGDVESLWSVASTMHNIAQTDGSGAVGSRGWSAAKLLRVLDDPTLLTQVAEQYFVAPKADVREKARRLLVHAGVGGAYGLYGARVKLARHANIRQPFVTLLKDFGPKAWPVVRASLEKIAVTPDPNPMTFDLAEDLLLCVPLVGDETAGHTVLKFLRWTHSGVCRAATAAIVKLWSDRAKPVLVAMVQSKDDVVRVAGIAGLRQLGAIDEHLVPRLHAILTRRVPAGEEVRGAAAVALAHASPAARKPATDLLAELLTPSRDEIPDLAPSSKQDAVVLAMAKSLLTLGGKPYQGVIAKRAEKSAEPLRAQLRGLLGS